MARFEIKKTPGRLLTEGDAKRAAGRVRYITKDELLEIGKTTPIARVPLDPYGFYVAAVEHSVQTEKNHVRLGPRNRVRAQVLFEHAYPKAADYRNAYGVGFDMAYFQAGEKTAPVKAATLNKATTNSVRQQGLDVKTWTNAFTAGMRDGVAVKQMHLRYRKTGQFGVVASKVLDAAKHVTAADDPPDSDLGECQWIYACLANNTTLTASFAAVTEADGANYFNANALNYAAQMSASPKSRTTIILMSPDTFLLMAKPLREPSVDKTARVASANGKFSDIPYLLFINQGDTFAKVVGHEGRHRMMYLKSKGVKQVPVLFTCLEGAGKVLRWGSATGFDYVDPWPSSLISEASHPLNTMDFPDSVIYPRKTVTASEEIDYRVYGYWITDDGKFIGVDNEEHAVTAYRWLKSNDPDAFEALKGDDRRVYDYQAFDALMDRGWIHITNQRHSCEIQIVNATVRTAAFRSLRKYFDGSEIEKIDVIIHNRNGSPIRKTFVEAQSAMDFIRQHRNKSNLTAWIEAAEVEIQVQELTAALKDMRFQKVGNERGRDFNGAWVLDLYDVAFGDEKVQLSVKRYPKDYTAKVDIFGNSANKFGPSNIRGLIQFIKKTYKNVYSIYGDRISGARKASGKLLNTAHIVIRKDKVMAASDDGGRKRGKSLHEQGKPDYIVIYRAVPRAQINFLPDDYVTLSKKFAIEHAEHGAAVDDTPYHVIKLIVSSKDVYDAYNPGEYFYGGPSKRGKVFYITGTQTEAQENTMSFEDSVKRVEFLMADADQTYTNKSKNVKLLYYANRSTPQTCKPGKTVKAKKGFGKRTAIKNATPEQIKTLKSGRWLRDREDGKKAHEKGAKSTKYRPWLTASDRLNMIRAGF